MAGYIFFLKNSLRKSEYVSLSSLEGLPMHNDGLYIVDSGSMSLGKIYGMMENIKNGCFIIATENKDAFPLISKNRQGALMSADSQYLKIINLINKKVIAGKLETLGRMVLTDTIAPTKTLSFWDKVWRRINQGT